MGGWQPDTANGSASASWGKGEHSREAQLGPDICWDRDGNTEPMGLIDMDEEEREVWSCIVTINIGAMLTCRVAVLNVGQHTTQAAY